MHALPQKDMLTLDSLMGEPHKAVKRQHIFLKESMHLLPLVTVLVLDTVM